MRILIISPQPWNHLQISKHHYALALVRLGHDVLFLEPPSPRVRNFDHKTKVQGHGNLSVLTYFSPKYINLRFHFPAYYSFFMNSYVRRLLRLVKFSPDLVWCFDTSLFPRIDKLGSQKSIYHPVDPIDTPINFLPARNATVVLTPSDTIAQSIQKHAGVDVHQINHGIGPHFAESSRRRLQELTCGSSIARKSNTKSLKLGYAGNLLHPNFNREITKRIISSNRHVEFNFWGSGTDSNDSFISYLRNQSNVVLLGERSEAQLATEYSSMDGFFLSYTKGGYDKSNSHKVIEYLSTGKAVFSSRLSQYVGREDLLYMSNTDDDSDLPDVITSGLQNLDAYNSLRRQSHRIAFALSNTYDEHVRTVLSLLDASIARGGFS
jgi:hypothetical protein